MHMMDYGLSDAEERAVFGYDEDECPVCDDECECDYEGTRLAAAFDPDNGRIYSITIQLIELPK